MDSYTIGAPLTPCWTAYQDALRSNAIDKFIPRCRPDGSYSPVQCYRSYCYCVNGDGQEISDTRTFIVTGKPKCTYTSEIAFALFSEIIHVEIISLKNSAPQTHSCSCYLETRIIAREKTNYNSKI